MAMKILCRYRTINSLFITFRKSKIELNFVMHKHHACLSNTLAYSIHVSKFVQQLSDHEN